MDSRLPRKLAAVLYADVAGYSRLTGIDEEGTHRQLGECLDLFDAAVGLHNGRTVHYAGDAILAEFETASDALSCAVATQREFAQRNAVIAAERRLQFRIGLNLGEVITDRGDIYGAGVNVAARLESLAEPGGICLSDAFRVSVGSRFDLGYESLGEQRVKNIDEPLRAFRVVDREGKAPASSRAVADHTARAGAAIAVLALQNMSGDAEQEYFSDGISEDIITDLSKLPGLTVIARNSSFAYKGRQVDIREVSEQLGVDYVLEGSVRKAGGRVRVTVQLIEGRTGAHAWAERYDRELTDIFEVQDEICREVVGAIGARLAPREETAQAPAGTSNLEAYDYFLRGRDQALRDTGDANRTARDLLSRAIELDSSFSLACSHLSRCYVLSYVNRWSEDPAGDIDRALDLAARAIDLDRANPHARFARAMAELWSRRHDDALIAVGEALDIDANFADGHAGKGLILIYMGRADEAIDCVERAMRLDPHYRDILLHVMALAHFHAGHLDTAADWLRRRLIRKPESDISRVLLAAALGHLGACEQARTQWDALMAVNPSYSISHRRRVLPYREPAAFDYVVDGLRAAGIDPDGNGDTAHTTTGDDQ